MCEEGCEAEIRTRVRDVLRVRISGVLFGLCIGPHLRDTNARLYKRTVDFLASIPRTELRVVALRTRALNKCVASHSACRYVASPWGKTHTGGANTFGPGVLDVLF